MPGGAAALPFPPPPPPFPTGGATGRIWGNFETFHWNSFLGLPVERADSTGWAIGHPGFEAGLTGVGFSYDAFGQATGGTATSIWFQEWAGGSVVRGIDLSLPGVSASSFPQWIRADATQTAMATILAGNDQLRCDWGADFIRGYAGDDLIVGGGGRDTLYGGAGDDQIYALLEPGISGFTGEGASYLRGEEGNDYIVGGEQFDDINGNVGNDIAAGGLGDDWVVGGKDQDLLYGERGNDIVYGNLGDDTCIGGDGDDLLRGGQNNDVLLGDSGSDWLSGKDWLSGDRGDDTMTGGPGADVFHTFGDAGLDRVTDFNLAEGDRVQLDAGTTYTVVQVDADTVITMSGGGRMVLVGVSLASLTPGWIFGF